MDKEQKSITSNLKTVAIIPAAGAGVRIGSDRAKQFVELDGRPLIVTTLEKFQVCSAIDGIIVVVPPNDEDYCRGEVVERYNLTKVEKVIAGGKRRQDSVRLGVEASRVAAARKHRAVITGLPAKETVKGVDRNGLVVKTYDRQQVWLVQTPQAFRYEDILMAHQRAVQEDWEEATDDALLVEKMGIPVKVIEGSEDNIKVTTPHDLEMVRVLLGGR
jgi:2-C-methyl-D-erythritol 4-phosphate cytidylyltransferase